MSDPDDPAPALQRSARSRTDAKASPPARAPIGAFVLDLVIALALMVASSIVLAIGWTVWRLLVIHRSHPALADDAGAALSRIGDPGTLAQLLMVLLSTGTAALALYALRQPATADERRQSLAALRQRSTWAWSAAVGTTVFLASNLLGRLMTFSGVEPVPTNLAMVEDAFQRWPWFLVLFVVVLAPMYEELLFRRVLFGRFLRAGWPWLGMVLSSVAFALVHEVPGLSDNSPAAVLQLWLVYGGMGAAFAWLYWRTGTLWAPILAHALNNGLALGLHVLGP